MIIIFGCIRVLLGSNFIILCSLVPLLAPILDVF